MAYEYSNNVPLEDRRYVLQHEGQYVERVDSVPHATVDTHFVFTPDREKAKQFSFNDLWNPKAVRPVGIQFSQGFAAGQAVRVV